MRALFTLTLSVAVFQTFLLENGVDENSLAAIISMLQLFQAAALFAFSSISDKIKNVIMLTAFSFLLCLPPCIYFIVVVIFPEVTINSTLLVILSSCFYIFNGIYGVISVKLQYLILPVEEFGVYTSVANLIIGVSGIIFSSIISSLQLAFASMPFMVISKNPTVFLTFYSVSYFAVSVINIVIPIIISKTIDYNIVGKYTGARLLLHTLGTSIGGFACIPLVNAIGAFATLLIAGATQLIVGISYFFYLKNEPRAKIKVSEIHGEIESKVNN